MFCFWGDRIWGNFPFPHVEENPSEAVGKLLRQKSRPNDENEYTSFKKLKTVKNINVASKKMLLAHFFEMSKVNKFINSMDLLLYRKITPLGNKKCDIPKYVIIMNSMEIKKFFRDRDWHFYISNFWDFNKAREISTLNFCFRMREKRLALLVMFAFWVL